MLVQAGQVFRKLTVTGVDLRKKCSRFAKIPSNYALILNVVVRQNGDLGSNQADDVCIHAACLHVESVVCCAC
jgi:hypothetical protein